MNNVEVNQKGNKITISIDLEETNKGLGKLVEVNTRSLNVRNNPFFDSVDNKVIGTLYRGERVTITDIWCTRGKVWGKLAEEDIVNDKYSSNWICLEYCEAVRMIFC